MDETPDNEPEDPTPPDGQTDASAGAAESPYGPDAPGAGSPYGPAAPTEGSPFGATIPPAPPTPPYAGWAPPTPPGPPIPPGPAHAGIGAAPPPNVASEKRPGVGAGVGTGCGLQVLGGLLFLATIAVIPYPPLMLWPFIVITVLAALLLFSKKWRRFATGMLIVAAAMWIVVIGPCYGLLVAPYSNA